MDERDMIFNNNNGNITAGGFNIKSLMMQLGISPITTVQSQSGGGSTNQVSDIFDGIIIPNWTYSHNELFKHNKCVMKENTDPDNCKVIDDDIYNQIATLLSGTFRTVTVSVTKKKGNSLLPFFIFITKLSHIRIIR